MSNQWTCLTTMIGSLPQKTPTEALKVLSDYPLTIPTWAQLPRRTPLEGMVPQCSEGFPGVQIDAETNSLWVQNDEDLPNALAIFYENLLSETLDPMAISESFAPGFHAFLRQLDSAESRPSIIKGQVTGPLTFGLGLTDQDRNAVWFDEQYRDVVLKGLGMKAQWQIRELKKRADQVLLFFDEPILSALGTPAYMGISDEQILTGLNEVIHAAQASGARVGIHCCGNMDWGLLAQTDLDIIAFDAYSFGEKIALYPEQVNAFLARGGTLAYGLIPTLEHEDIMRETADSLLQRLQSLLDLYIQKGLPQDLLYKQLILTPACGMGSLPAPLSERVLDLLSQTCEHGTQLST
jgi:methionine synthase II (cobalamin-independent)